MTQATQRTCDDCGLCCKLPSIPALNKPQGEWCTHCSTRTRCDIYDTRPQPCRDFNCMYITNPEIGEEWKPTRAKMFLSVREGGKLVVLTVDPARADGWRKEPYFSTLQHWSKQVTLLVDVKGHMHAIFPTHVDHLGVLGENDRISTVTVQTPQGPITRAVKLGPHDPVVLP